MSHFITSSCPRLCHRHREPVGLACKCIPRRCPTVVPRPVNQTEPLKRDLRCGTTCLGWKYTLAGLPRNASSRLCLSSKNNFDVLLWDHQAFSDQKCQPRTAECRGFLGFHMGIWAQNTHTHTHTQPSFVCLF
jgi:hypothetical protein